MILLILLNTLLVTEACFTLTFNCPIQISKFFHKTSTVRCPFPAHLIRSMDSYSALCHMLYHCALVLDKLLLQLKSVCAVVQTVCLNKGTERNTFLGLVYGWIFMIQKNSFIILLRKYNFLIELHFWFFVLLSLVTHIIIVDKEGFRIFFDIKLAWH